MLLNLWLRLLPVVADVQLSVATVDDRTVVVRERLFVHLHRRCNVMQSSLTRHECCACVMQSKQPFILRRNTTLEVCFVGQQQQQQQQQINQFFFSRQPANRMI